MPIEPSSLPAGFTSATAGTDIVMQTATQRNVDLAAAFAEILGASIVSAEQPSGASPSAVCAFSEKPIATVSSSTMLDSGKRLGKPHQAAESPELTSSDSAVTLYPEIPGLMNGFAVPLGATPMQVAADANAAAPVAVSSDDATDDLAQQPQAPGQEPQSSAKPGEGDWPLNFTTTQSSECSSPHSFGVSTVQSSAALVQSAMSFMAGMSSSEPPVGTLVQETGATTNSSPVSSLPARKLISEASFGSPAITIEAGESAQTLSDAGSLTQAESATSSVTLPRNTGVQNPSGTVAPSNVSASSGWNEARSAIAAAPIVYPASTATSSFLAMRSAASTEHELRAVTASSGSLAPLPTSAGPATEPTSQTTDVAAPPGVVGSQSSPTIRLASAHQQQQWRHASPEITMGTTAPRDPVAKPAPPTTSFASERPTIQLQTPKNSPMTVLSGQPNVLQSRANADPQLSEAGETFYSSLPTPTDQHVSLLHGESVAISSAFQPVASTVSNASTTSSPSVVSQAPTSASPKTPTSSVTVVSVPVAASVLGPNGAGQPTQGASGDPNSFTSRPTITLALGTQLSSTSLKSETPPSQQFVVESKIPQTAQAGPAKIETTNATCSPHPASTEIWPRAAVRGVPSISDSPVSLPQASQSTPESPTHKTKFLLEQPAQASSSNNTKIDLPHEDSSSAPQTAPNSRLTQSGSSKVHAADPSPAPSIPVTATEDADSPSMEQGTDAASSGAAYSTTTTPDAYGSESSSSTWSGVGTSATLTSDSGAPGVQTQTNTHSSRSQDSAANTSTEPLAPTPGSSDAPGSTQALSAATSAPKVDSLGSPTSGATAKSTSTPNDLGTPSEVFGRKPAENVELSSGLQTWNGGDNAQTRLIQSANLGGNLRSSEMNITLHAESLGPVELHTRIMEDVVGASIGVERHDAHAMIASELPALHQALNDRQLRVGDLSVFQGSVHSDGGTGDGRPSQQREAAQQSPATTTWAAEENSTLPEIAALSESSDSGTLFDSNGRLSVRA